MSIILFVTGCKATAPLEYINKNLDLSIEKEEIVYEYDDKGGMGNDGINFIRVKVLEDDFLNGLSDNEK